MYPHHLTFSYKKLRKYEYLGAANAEMDRFRPKITLKIKVKVLLTQSHPRYTQDAPNCHISWP